MASALVIGWLPEPETRPFWPDLMGLLKRAADRGGCEAFVPGDQVWIASDAGIIVGAATSRLLDGEAEIKHIAGTRFREWVPDMEAMICSWARDCGAVRAVSRGRKGWVRINNRMGWQMGGKENGLTLYEKAL